MAQVQGDAVVVQALLDIPGQAAGIGQHLKYRLHLRALQGQTPRHNHADVAGTHNDDFLAHHGIVKIDIALSHAGVINSRGSGAGDGQRAPGTLPAPHSQDDGFRLHLEQAVPRGCGDNLVPGQVNDGGVGDGFNAQLLRHVDKALGILRAAEGLAEAGQAEAVMDTLAQNAAKLLFPLDNENVVHALLFQLDGSRKSGGAAADNDYIMRFHYFTSPTNI